MQNSGSRCPKADDTGSIPVARAMLLFDTKRKGYFADYGTQHSDSTSFLQQ